MALRSKIVSYFFIMIIKNIISLKCYDCNSEKNPECNLTWTAQEADQYRKFIQECDKNDEMCSQKIGMYFVDSSIIFVTAVNTIVNSKI